MDAVHGDDLSGLPLLVVVGGSLGAETINDAVRRGIRKLSQRYDVVHVHNTFPLLSPSVLDACRDAAVPVVATLHNYLQVCPSGTLYRDGETRAFHDLECDWAESFRLGGIDFVDALLEGRQPAQSCADARQARGLALAAARSAEQGREVEVAELIGP